MTPRQSDTPRIPLGTRPVKHCRVKLIQTDKPGYNSTPKRTPRALARGRHETGVSGEALVVETCRVLDSVRVEGRVPLETWRQSLQIMIDEAEDAIAERCPTWVDDPGSGTTWNGNDHGLRDN